MLDGDEDERLLTLTTKEVKQLAKMADSQLVNERSVRIIHNYSIYSMGRGGAVIVFFTCDSKCHRRSPHPLYVKLELMQYIAKD